MPNGAKGVAISAGERDDAFEIGNGPWAVRTTDLDLDLQSFACGPGHGISPPGEPMSGRRRLRAPTSSNSRPRRRRRACCSMMRRRCCIPATRGGATTPLRCGDPGRPSRRKPSWKPILDTSPIEVVIVGDITPEAAIAAVARTFGALRPRPDRPEPPGLRDVRLHAPTPAPIVLRHDGTRRPGHCRGELAGDGPPFCRPPLCGRENAGRNPAAADDRQVADRTRQDLFAARDGGLLGIPARLGAASRSPSMLRRARSTPRIKSPSTREFTADTGRP